MKDFFHEQSFTSTNSVPLQSFVSSQGPTSDQSWNSWCLGLTDAARCVLVVQEWTKYTPPKNSVAKATWKELNKQRLHDYSKRERVVFFLEAMWVFEGATKPGMSLVPIILISENSCDQTLQMEVMAYLFCRNHIQNDDCLRNNGHFYNGNLRGASQMSTIP